MAEAIKLYQTIVQKYGTDKKLAAKALVQMGQCYEKLGSTEARKATAASRMQMYIVFTWKSIPQ